MELSKKTITPMVATIIGVSALGIGFGSGVWYQKKQNFSNFRERVGNIMENRQQGSAKSGHNQRGTGNLQMGLRGQNVVSGEVTSMEDKSITIKMNDGSSVIVIVDDSTQYTTSTDVNKDQVSVGTKVAVFGEENQSGAIDASSIEINPALRGQQN